MVIFLWFQMQKLFVYSRYWQGKSIEEIKRKWPEKHKQITAVGSILWKSRILCKLCETIEFGKHKVLVFKINFNFHWIQWKCVFTIRFLHQFTGGKSDRTIELDMESLTEKNSVLNNLNSLLGETLSFNRLKVLSPRLFEIAPPKKSFNRSANFPMLMSPSLLSFYDGPELFSLPRLFRVGIV